MDIFIENNCYLSAKLSILTHWNFVDVEKDSGKMTKQKRCCQTKESDV